MAVLSSLRQWLQTRSKKRRRQGERCQIRPRRRANVRLQVEQLEVRLTPAALSLLASFDGTGGGGNFPYAGVIEDASGNLFGTTYTGGTNGVGTVYEVVHNSGVATTLANMIGTSGAPSSPYAGLVEDSSGNLFGTTYGGGENGKGTVYEVVHNSGVATVLASFAGTDGANPTGKLVEDANGNLFGTAGYGSGASVNGTVFEVKAGSGAITVLAAFDGTDGATPTAGLIEDANGNLFGTATAGGLSNAGTVFEVKAGSGAITVLAALSGTDGSEPTGGLVEDSNANLFGTTLGGTSASTAKGTVFEVKAGSGAITTLAAFNGTDGATPVYAALVEDSNGNLFGTTSIGGENNLGTVFELVNSGGSYSSTPTVLHSFAGSPSDGYGHDAGLIEDSSGNFFGTTFRGGANSSGTVFELTAAVAAPTVTGINPTTGPTSGGTSVTITGTNLAGATAVDFGTTAATIVSDTATQIVATSPAGTAGQVANVTVTTAGGTSATSELDRFTYVAAPTVTGINPPPTRPPPFVSVAFESGQEVMEVVTADGILTQFDAFGAHQLATGVRSASVAFGPFGEVIVVVYQNGQLVQYDAFGTHFLSNGILSAGIGIFAGQEVLEIVAADGTLTQFDAFGAHPLTTGVRSASVAFGPFGEALDLVFADGQLFQLDPGGVHLLGNGVLSAGVAFGPFGEVMDTIFADGSLFQFEVAGIHKLGVLALV